ncbi:MAG: M1 family aminopeptidase [Pyrinomonadaceae bacterium]
MRAKGEGNEAKGTEGFFFRLALRFVPFALCLCVASSDARSQTVSQRPGAGEAAQHARYKIAVTLDFDARTYEGTEVVRWINRDTRPAGVIYFHLYPNQRAEIISNATPPRANVSPAAEEALSDEPRLEVMKVTSGAQPLAFSTEDQGTTLRVGLREAVAGGAAAEISITFKGSVPEIDADETSLPAHVVQQVGAALRDSRETRRARDTNFSSRGVMLLGSFYPVLAVRDGNDWQRKIEMSVGDTVYTEVADYDVTINSSGDVALFSSGREGFDAEYGRQRSRQFTGENLRNFAFVAGRTLRSAEREVAGIRVRSIYTTEHERVGQRALAVASEAVRVYTSRFGALPLKTVSVTEAPLVAGVGSTEFAGLGVIASAFYVDFDSSVVRNLPELVREQRASVEDSLEFAVAHVIAHQWWGATVGSDPERTPVLDEALAHWSALLYYSDAHDAARATQAQEDQLRGVYQIYRTFGGEDMTAERAAREYRNSFQYAAIVAAKGALMFAALHEQLKDERFFKALRAYYETNKFEIAEVEDLRGAFVAEAPLNERRAVTRIFARWLSEKHGDEDIAPPNPQLAAALGLPAEQSGAKDRNAFSRLGRFFWRQMTRIR